MAQPRPWELDIRAVVHHLLSQDGTTIEMVEGHARRVAKQELALRSAPEKVSGIEAARRLEVPLRTFWRHISDHAADFAGCRSGSRFLWPEVEDVHRRLFG